MWPRVVTIHLVLFGLEHICCAIFTFMGLAPCSLVKCHFLFIKSMMTSWNSFYNSKDLTLSRKSSSECGSWGGTVRLLDRKESKSQGERTHKTWMFECIILWKGEVHGQAPINPKSQKTRGMNAWEEGWHTRHGHSNGFVKRKGAWASPNQPQFTGRTNARYEGLRTRHECSNAFVKRGGAWASLTRSPSLKTNKHTRESLMHERWMFECLCK